MVVGQAAPWFREACAIVDLVVLDLSFRVIGVRAGLFWARVACVSSCIGFATRIALCVCCFLSTSFEVVWRRYLKDGTEPSQALPGHVVLAVVVARGLSERWCVLVLFTFHVLADLTCLLAVDGVRAVVRCRRHRFGVVLHESIFFKSVFFLPCVFPSQ